MYDLATLLINHGANVEARSNEGYSPISLAGFYNKPKVARLLIEHGARLDVRDDLGTASSPREATFSATSSSLQDSPRYTLPLISARRNAVIGRPSPIFLSVAGIIFRSLRFPGQLLIEYKAAVEAKNNAGDTPLSLACLRARPGFASLMLRHKASVATKNNRG
jgi:ankyrin repeat protein